MVPTIQSLVDEGRTLDLTNPKIVQIETNHDKTVIWVNVEGVCVLRCCQIENLIVLGETLQKGKK